jgi:DNA-directed RNA polymerase specialized sigma24 family protein
MWLAGSAAMRTTKPSQIEQLVEQYYLPLFRFAARLCDSPANALILTQRTFRLAFDRSRSLPVPANSRAWLFAILFSKFLEGRSRTRRA